METENALKMSVLLTTMNNMKYMNMFYFYVQVKFRFVWVQIFVFAYNLSHIRSFGSTAISSFPHHDEGCCSEATKVPFEITGPKASKGHRPWLRING